MRVREFEQSINYLRISVTDRCNLRCVYCMPEDGIVVKAHDELLTFEEILRLAGIFASLGVKRIRLTGGEPLVRKGIVELVRILSKIEGIEEVSLTTNGVLLSQYIGALKKANLKRINISLDTLREDRFSEITRGKDLTSVLRGIKDAQEAGFHPLKLNMVVMKGINDDEILDFLSFSRSNRLILRFIEFMKVTPLWQESCFFPIEKVKSFCEKRYKLVKMDRLDSGPAEYYRTKEGFTIGFIKTDEYNCRQCTRLRLTSIGELKICLYEDKGLSLKPFLRSGMNDEEIRNIIIQRVKAKRSIDYRYWEAHKVYMSRVGG